jgi:hypothetical protein
LLLYYCLTLSLYSILAEDEERDRMFRNRAVNVDAGDDTDELRGGAGDLVESDNINPRGRAMLMAIYARLLTSGGGVYEVGDEDPDGSHAETLRFLRAMAEDDGTEDSLTESGGEDRGGGEEDMDTAE